MAHNDKNSEVYKEYKQRSVDSVRKWRENAKKSMIHAMGGKCQICGYDRHHKALEMHHIDPSIKEKSFGNLMAAPGRLEDWHEELEKCVLLCANCHREVHAEFVNIPEDYFRFDKNILNSYLKKTNRVLTPKGSAWITNGHINKKIKALDTIPDGWYKGRINNS